MTLQKLNWKLFIANPDVATPTAFFRLFNTWIPNSDEIFVDVVDYSHVADGPLTVLIGHHADYALDETGHRRGLRYAHRQPLTGSNTDALALTLKAALTGAQRAASDALFNGQLQFVTNTLTLIVNDRAIAPNTAHTFKTLEADLQKFADRLYGTGNATLTHHDDPKQRFSVTITSSGAPTLDDLLARLS